MTREQEIAWAAGLFEGEGYAVLNKRKPVVLRLAIEMTDRDVIERFATIVGVGNANGPRRRSNPRWQPLWRWQSDCIGDIRHVLGLIGPYLLSRRAAKVAELLEEYERDHEYLRTPIPCRWCGAGFLPRRRDGAFCSLACSKRDWSARGTASRRAARAAQQEGV